MYLFTVSRDQCLIVNLFSVLPCFPMQRHAWFPYFDDINAIIFLAPISCFDEKLAEDPSVNRLQDSMLLWKAVCSSKLLKKVQLILVRGLVYCIVSLF